MNVRTANLRACLASAHAKLEALMSEPLTRMRMTAENWQALVGIHLSLRTALDDDDLAAKEERTR